MQVYDKESHLWAMQHCNVEMVRRLVGESQSSCWPKGWSIVLVCCENTKVAVKIKMWISNQINMICVLIFYCSCGVISHFVLLWAYIVPFLILCTLTQMRIKTQNWGICPIDERLRQSAPAVYRPSSYSNEKQDFQICCY